VSLALANMARDDPHASSTASSTARRPQAARRPQCAVKWDQNLKPKFAIMRQCTFITDRRTHRRTDGLASWHKCKMYILHLAVKIQSLVTVSNYAEFYQICKRFCSKVWSLG